MNLWRGRINPDPEDRLLHQVVQPLDMSNDLFTSGGDQHIALLGFASDEGVRRNMGRQGARRAPEVIKKMAAGLSVHFDIERRSIYDAGNVLCANQNLEAAQRLLGEKIAGLLHQGITPLVLGGGHETSFGHFLGLRNFVPRQQKIGIINIDAHFDVRSYEQGPHSGSPFRQIAELDPAAFHYLPIGIRPESNVSSLFRTMKDMGQSFITLEEVHSAFGFVLERVKKFCQSVDHLYLTIDMDAFSAAYAPGVSAPAPDGILPFQAVQIIKIIKASGRYLSGDIVEMNPDFDIDHRTAKLAALMIYHLIN